MHIYPVLLVYKHQVRALHLLLVTVATWIVVFIHKNIAWGTKIVILILGIGFQATSRDNKNMDHLVGSRRVARIIPIKQVQHETVHNIILTYISKLKIIY